MLSRRVPRGCAGATIRPALGGPCRMRSHSSGAKSVLPVMVLLSLRFADRPLTRVRTDQVAVAPEGLVALATLGEHVVLPVAVAERVPLRVAAIPRVALADDLVVERRVPVGSFALVVVADLAAVEVWVVVEVAAVRHDELADGVAERDRLGVAA